MAADGYKKRATKSPFAFGVVFVAIVQTLPILPRSTWGRPRRDRRRCHRCDLKDQCLWIFVDSDDDVGGLHPGLMLNGSLRCRRHINSGSDGTAGLSDLMLIGSTLRPPQPGRRRSRPSGHWQVREAL
jgi:hypothetical protein